MNPITNPFAPGAGTPPPALTGREALRDAVHIAAERTRRGLPTQSVLLVGLRGVGKTVLLNRMREDAEGQGFQTLSIEAPEGRSLPSMLAPQLRQVLLRIGSKSDKAKDLARRGLSALAGFVKALKVKYSDIEVGIDFEPEAGLADNGDLEHDLQALLEAVGAAARAADTAVLMLIDELQYVAESELAALVTALHRCAQRRSPVMLIGAGLPQLRGRMGNAKLYAERLFSFPELGPLLEDEGKRAIVKPIEDQNQSIEPEAAELIVQETRGYPYFLQEWGKHAWDCAESSPVTRQHVETASRLALAALDESFFRVRFDRLTPAERKYLRAMAELGPGPHRSGDIATCLRKKVSSLGPTRNSLIAKGMVWSPNHGDTAFTVPLFDEFMKRIVPGDDWR